MIDPGIHIGRAARELAAFGAKLMEHRPIIHLFFCAYREENAE